MYPAHGQMLKRGIIILTITIYRRVFTLLIRDLSAASTELLSPFTQKIRTDLMPGLSLPAALWLKVNIQKAM